MKYNIKRLHHKSFLPVLHARLALLAGLVLLVSATLLSGCGTSAGEDENASEALTYRLSEQVIQSPEAAFRESADGGQSLFSFPADSFSAGKKLYFLYDVLRYEGELNTYDGSCLCVLEAPYEQWQFYTLPCDCWSADTELFAQGIAGVTDEGIYLALAQVDSNGTFIPQCLGFYGWDGSCSVLDELPIDSVNLALYREDDLLYCLSDRSFTAYGETPQTTSLLELKNKLRGCMIDQGSNRWYGFDSEGLLTVWDGPYGEPLFSLGNLVKGSSDFCLARSSSGRFILTDISGIWTGDGKKPLEKVLSFADRDYLPEELLGVCVNEDDSLSIITSFDDKLYLLTAEQCSVSELPVKQEITLVTSQTPWLEKIALGFNRQSPLYRVILVEPDISDSYAFQDYCQNIQLEISAGRGPDLISSQIISPSDYVENGYLEALDDVLENPSDYWTGILDTGKIDGITYGIPYTCTLSLPVASKSLTGELEAWNMEQMMECVRNSPAETLSMDMDGLRIALRYCLTNKNNPRLIDYDAGVSHLTEQLFVDFLEFAKSYGDSVGYRDAAEEYREGRLAVFDLTITRPEDLLFAAECFQGEETFIGLPSEQGRGISVESDLLYLNSSSQCKEGAKEFLRYLMSEDGQLSYVSSFFHKPFSCRRDVTEAVVEEFQSAQYTPYDIYDRQGVSYQLAPLDEDQLRQLWELFEDAGPAFSLPEGLLAIVIEELSPFFAGDCSAEDAAQKLDNRIQLYFDERR